MVLSFVNDPKFEELPLVGGVPALLALRSACGVAVRWDPVGGDPVALSTFLGDEFVSFEGKVFQRVSGGSLVPVDWSLRAVVVVRPPAGAVFTVAPTAEGLTSQYARVVEVPVEFPVEEAPPADGGGDDMPVDTDGDGVVDVYEAQTVAQLVEVLRERELPVSGTKAELVARLHEDDAAKVLPAPDGVPAPDPAPVG